MKKIRIVAHYRQRLLFFNQLLALPLFQPDYLHLETSETSFADPGSPPSPSLIPMLIMGDFNFHAYAPQTIVIDYTTDTFLSSPPLDSSSSTSTHSQRSGLWRSKPNLATNQYFIDDLFQELDTFFFNQSLAQDIDLSASLPVPTPQEIWDALKLCVKKVVLRVNRRKCQWRARLIKRLQNKRKRLLELNSDTQELQDRIAPIEEQLSAIQIDLAKDQALRAGRH
ncbi:hypothetical protein [Parasitella parasitica]|uniref:Uncharacterized protein n=1 Tax=Parasitella parasitica TaxID=35722 RepID=A0A0B7N4M8_9FUNG|nr:hypothetical protein [Parasitella parasitica]